MKDQHRITAFHEAAHAVVLYRTMGVADDVSIIPGPVTTSGEGDVLRSLGETCGYGDRLNRDHMKGRVLSCYAGGHAQRRCDPTEGTLGCEADDEIAAEVMRRNGWECREREFRDRSSDLVDQHWLEIAAVAEELLRTPALDRIEIELIADATVGRTDFSFGSLQSDLAHYRAFRAAGAVGGA
jgi:hypothetical protein